MGRTKRVWISRVGALLAALCLVAGPLSGCARSGDSSEAGQKAAEAGAEEVAPELASNDGSTVVAVVGDRVITSDELDRELRDQLLKLELDYKRSVHRARRQMLQNIVDSQLVQSEAARREVTPAELGRTLQEEAAAVSEEEIRALFEQLGDGVQGSYEENRAKLEAYLVNQRYEKGKVDFVERLRDQTQIEFRLSYPSLPVLEIPGDGTGPSRGPRDAPVTIVEFSDFQCVFCRQVQETLNRVLEAYPSQVRLVYRHFPLRNHDLAGPAAEASVCAEEQGRFWAYHDALFAHQDELSEPKLLDLALQADLDTESFEACLAEGRYRERVAADFQAGREGGVRATPAFFVNGRPIFGVESLETFRELIDRELERSEG
jgi:protein-disulfide isomerase